MTLRSVSKTAMCAAGLAAALAAAACSRDHIEAINLANEGDRQVKVNVEGAIQKYEQATQLDPTNHRILHKLANAYEKKEDWEKMASTMARAAQVAPDFASYWFRRGYALMKVAEAGNADAYEQAKEPLKQCVAKDANYAECYHFLAEASLWTDDMQNALVNYTNAIAHNPTVAYFYPPLGEAYVTLKFYDEADKVLSEGTRLILPSEKNNSNLYGMYVLLFEVAQARDDKPAMVAAMERAQEVAGDSHPEIAFNLGSTYAVMEPPRKEKAVRLLSSFTKRACRGANASKFKEQCETSQSLIQMLGGKVD
ncbi:MAG: tetratricopeptide repeat protein [Polyangiaceae bacterium]|nr:tetratricopeptide repeat protein [Polyangiaceae bacterium]